jgi:hypothetical protein
VSYLTNIYLLCAVPYVTLEGTVEDWEALERRAARLVEFDTDKKYMQKWYALLGPVLAELTRSAKGNPQLDWWERVCNKFGGGSGPRYLSGWITVFCVFNESGKWVGDQYKQNSGWRDGTVYSSACSFAKEGWPIVNFSDLPNGYCKVDVTVDDNGTVYKCEMLAGHRSFVVLDKNKIQPQVPVLTEREEMELRFRPEKDERSCF